MPLDLKRLRPAGRVAIGLAAVMGVVVGYAVHAARASGIPSPATLSYSGSLLTFGAPDNGTHNMTLSLYVSTMQVCTVTQSVTCVNGRFTIPLPAACTSAIQTNPNVDVELDVDSVIMGRSPLSAVPYAVIAGGVSASDVTGVLAVANGGTGSATQNFVDLTTAQSVAGVKTFTAPVTMACASGFTAVNNGRLCVDSTLESAAGFYAAEPLCWAKLKNQGIYAHVCHYTEAQDACGAYLNGSIGFDFYAGVTTGWYSDETSDDVFETWNDPSCQSSGNNNGPAMNASTSLAYRCCY